MCRVGAFLSTPTFIAVTTGECGRGPSLVIVRICGWPLDVNEVLCIFRRGNRLELQRRLSQRKTIRKIVCRAVGVSKRWQVERALDELQYATEVVCRMRNVGSFGVWRDNDQRHAKPVYVS